MNSVCHILRKNNILERATEVFGVYLESGNHWSFFHCSVDRRCITYFISLGETEWQSQAISQHWWFLQMLMKDKMLWMHLMDPCRLRLMFLNKTLTTKKNQVEKLFVGFYDRVFVSGVIVHCQITNKLIKVFDPILIHFFISQINPPTIVIAISGPIYIQITPAASTTSPGSPTHSPLTCTVATPTYSGHYIQRANATASPISPIPVASTSNRSPMDTLTAFTPATPTTPTTPIPGGQRVEMIVCLCFVNTLALHRSTIALQRCAGRSAIIRRPIAISKRQIFPFRVRIGK
ncbi:hypothetical protein ROHU_005667 [Labeo rohita]|uniref:Uncharacterized protein n=1 Tax=Labeo rohita TaxID=84645 RepID=A0A498N4H7_LABRO|nr:hypothetical protein ROHU_005667 [Labeo rohita]